MSNLYTLIGLPSSGKSSYAERAELQGYIVHSSDAIRIELFGDVNHQDDNDLVFKTLHQRIKRDLQHGRNVCFDACNINYKKRMEFLRQLNGIDCNKIAVLFATPYQDCEEYNQLREKSVPNYVIGKMLKNFYIPQSYEGWDSVEIVWNFKPEDFNLPRFLGELDKEDQDNPHHSLTVGKHMKKCSDVLISKLREIDMSGDLLYEHDIRALILASDMHDCAKPYCKEFNEKKGHSVYYQHHLVGAYIALFYLKTLKYSDRMILDVANYIQWHMKPFEINGDKKAEDKFIKLVGKRTYDNICLLHEADKLAK